VEWVGHVAHNGNKCIPGMVGKPKALNDIGVDWNGS